VVRRAARRLARIFIGLIVVLLILIGVGISVLETGWAKNRLRDLMVVQANQYLNATLTIGRLGGSILRGLELGDVRLTREGRDLVRIDEIALAYSIRELIESGTVIRRIRLTRPQFEITRLPDGRWDLGAIVKRERREGPRSGPNRPIQIQRVEITGGRVRLNNPLDFGAAHAPTEYDNLDATFGFAYFPVRWRLDFERLTFVGRAPDLTMSQLTGGLGTGPGGWFFDRLSIATPRSAYTLNGRVVRGGQPTSLDLDVHATRFAFQEWSGVLRGLRNIAIDGSFDAALKGPLSRLGTDIRLSGTGGSVSGHLTLDTTVPGWRGAGTVDVGRLNLARWLNNPARPSDITGRVSFDLALELGRRFPRGVYTFDGPHAMYMDYAADNLKAQGQITQTAVLVRQATATAYGAGVATTDGSIGIASPYPYHFAGTVTRIDLRDLPRTIPVPHVESVLTFDYDVNGQFSQPFIAGSARFKPSEFLGAALADGVVGTIDTQQRPLRFGGDGYISNVDLHRFGRGLDVAWLQDPRYDGTIAGRFHVDGSGTDRAALQLTGGGRLERGTLFHGTLADAEVSIAIQDGTLRASYDGGFTGIDPAIPFADPRWQAALTGNGTMTATVAGLLTRDVTLADYDVAGTLALGRSVVRGLEFDRGRVEATLRGGTLAIARVDAAGPALEGSGSGTLAIDDTQSNAFQYDITRADLSKLEAVIGAAAAGTVATKGRMTGPWSALAIAGEGSVAQLDAFQVKALTLDGRYTAGVSTTGAAPLTGRLEGRGSFLTIAGRAVNEASGTITLDRERLIFDLRVLQAPGRTGTIVGSAQLRLDDRAADLVDLTIGLGRAPWRLVRGDRPATISWNDSGVSVSPVVFAGAGDERIRIGGDWRNDGNGAIRVVATRVFLDTLQSAFDRPTRYGGVLDADATIRNGPDGPIVAGTVTISNGRVERISYQKLTGRVDYFARAFTVDLRLDQSPGIWVTAAGTVPLALIDSSLPPQPINVAVQSSGVNLGLLEGVTDVVRRVSGELRLDVRAVGTSNDPHFTGSVTIDRAAFDVAATGSKYKNAQIALRLSTDRVDVERFHIEDNNGRPLELRGSLGTHELRVGNLEIEIAAQKFEVLHNVYGRMEIDSRLQLRGQFESPRLTGQITVSSSELRVDEILQRTLFQPYATEETAITTVDPVAALNPWDRLGMNIILHVPNTLRFVGENVQVSPGTPIGLGDINLRVTGDLSFYKDPNDTLYVNGSFDGVSGTYAFQGRRFDVDPASSILFRGDLNPELYVGVTRLIQGVQVRVVLVGPLRQPELRLASVPPLTESDILSLVVFNTATNQLTAEQQQDLVVRAGSLAAGFLATPLVSAISNQIGLDILDVAAEGDAGRVGAKVTVGQELAPGLVARFSRQFGPEPYDEATIEYYLSKILRLRATFSDAQTLNSRSPFRRVERAGVDLLFFFSF
jgi:autotransporter translocation and assembly factor TamB